MRPDGALIAVVTPLDQVEVQDTVSGRVIARPALGSARPTALRFSADGDTLAIGTFTGTVTIYDAREEYTTSTFLRGQRATVSQIANTGDDTIAVVFVDDTLRLFDPSGAPLGDAIPIAAFSTVAVTADAVAFTDPGYWLVVVDLDVSRWPGIAEAWAGRTLTDAERQQFGLP